jgi:hypothetical protein
MGITRPRILRLKVPNGVAVVGMNKCYPYFLSRSSTVTGILEYESNTVRLHDAIIGAT